MSECITYHPPVGTISPDLSPGEHANAKRVIGEMNQPNFVEDDLIQRNANLWQIIQATNLGIIPPDILQQVQQEIKTNPSRK